MTPPAAPQARDRPTIPLPSLASLGRPALKTPPSPTAIAPLYRPVAGGPTVYRPASSYSGGAPPRPQRSPVHAAPPRRWPFVGGAVVILLMIGTVSVGTFGPASTGTTGVPGTTAPVTTQRNPGAATAVVPTPSVPVPALVLRTPATPRTVPAPKRPRVVLPVPRSVPPTPVIAPTATLVPTATPVPTPTPVPTATPEVKSFGPGDQNRGSQLDQKVPAPGANRAAEKPALNTSRLRP